MLKPILVPLIILMSGLVRGYRHSLKNEDLIETQLNELQPDKSNREEAGAQPQENSKEGTVLVSDTITLNEDRNI